MANSLIAFIAALGAGAWVYAKTSRRSGGNAKSSLAGAALVGAIVFVIILTLLGALDRYLQR